MRKVRAHISRFWALSAMVIACALPTFAQANQSSSNGYSTFDVTLFGGGQWFQAYQGVNTSVQKFSSSGAFGARFGADFTNYIGIEAGFTTGGNNLLLRPVG